MQFGMSGALETLCGQAFGAEQYQGHGTYTYGAIICLFIVCIPISLLWIFTDKLLILTGQDPAIATKAGKYLIWLIPILHSLVRFLQTQEFNLSNAAKYSCICILTTASLLGTCIQVEARECCISFVNWYIILVIRHLTCAVCEVFFFL